MGSQPLPGLQALYSFVPSGESVLLSLSLEFDPARVGAGEDARQAWAALRDRPAAADAALVTTVAGPITVTADGGGLADRIADFAAAVAAGLAAGNARPSVLDLAFHLDPAAAVEWPQEVFELLVQLDLGDGTGLSASPCPGDDGGEREAALVRFAAGFERAWDGFDGDDGMVKLAAAAQADPPRLWCLRISRATGMAIARTGSAGPFAYAAPPLSTLPLFGSVDDVDGPDGSRAQFAAIDLDGWWDIFAAELERLSTPPLAEAISEASPEAADRLVRVREAIARAQAARLAPLAAAAPAEAGWAEARVAFEEAVEADLGCRSPVAAVAVAVRGASNATGPVLRGSALSPPDASGTVRRQPAALRLQAGERRLFLVAPRPGEDRPDVAFDARFEGDRLDLEGAPPLRLLPGPSPLHVDLGPISVPVPLIAHPSAPSIVGQSARAAEAPATLAEALVWSVEAEIGLEAAGQDRLELVLHFDRGAAEPGPSPPPAAGDLFGALARFVRLAQSRPLQAEAIDASALGRFVALAEAVGEALPGWAAPVPNPLPARPAGGWRYALDFADSPNLAARRGSDLPPWPRIAGYAEPTSTGSEGEYRPVGPAAPRRTLRIAIPGLRLPAERAVRFSASIVRNGGLLAAEAVNPAFVYRSAAASGEPVAPCQDWQAPTPDAAPTLRAVLVRALEPLEGESGATYAIGVEAELAWRMADGGDPALETRMPILAAPEILIGTDAGAVSLAAFRAELAAALSAGRALLDPEAQGAEIHLTVTLRDPLADSPPLARLGLMIPVPPEDGWWQAGSRDPD